MDNDLAACAARFGLESHAQPAMRFGMLLKTPGRNRVGKNEKRFVGPEFFVQPFDQKIVLAIQHGLETSPTDIPVGGSVDRVAKRHVIGRHGLRDRACGATHLEKPARYFLSSADLGKSAISLCIEVNLERLLV